MRFLFVNDGLTCIISLDGDLFLFNLQSCGVLPDGFKYLVKNLVFEVRLPEIQTVIPFFYLVRMNCEKKHVPPSRMCGGHVDHLKKKEFFPGIFIKV